MITQQHDCVWVATGHLCPLLINTWTLSGSSPSFWIKVQCVPYTVELSALENLAQKQPNGKFYEEVPTHHPLLLGSPKSWDKVHGRTLKPEYTDSFLHLS